MTRAEQLAHYTDTAAALSQGDRIAQLEAQLAQVAPLIHGIAEWERKNGSASAICGNEECAEMADIVERWAVTHSARELSAALAKAGASHV
jgi:hypothetical protein